MISPDLDYFSTSLFPNKVRVWDSKRQDISFRGCKIQALTGSFQILAMGLYNPTPLPVPSPLKTHSHCTSWTYGPSSSLQFHVLPTLSFCIYTQLCDKLSKQSKKNVQQKDSEVPSMRSQVCCLILRNWHLSHQRGQFTLPICPVLSDTSVTCHTALHVTLWI